MPGTAAKKYEEGIFMKKIVKGILLLAAAAAVVTGCSRIAWGEPKPPLRTASTWQATAVSGGLRWRLTSRAVIRRTN